MSWTLTIGGVQVQDYVKPFTSLKVRYRGYGGVGTLNARFVDEGSSLVLQNEAEVSLVDNGTKVFGGYVRRRTRKDFNVQGIRVYEIQCQDFNSDPSDDWVPVGTGPRTTAETDKERITWLFSTYGTRSVDASTAYVQNTRAEDLMDMDFQGMTLAQALDEICKVTGAQWYVDENRKLHYFTNETVLAPWDIDIQSPNGTSTFPARDFTYPDDTIDYVNTVAVIGAGVYAVRYRGGTPPAAGSQRLLVHQDSNLGTTTNCEEVGDAILDAEDTRNDGSLTVWKAGLQPGQVIHIKNTQYGFDDDFRITQVSPRYVDLDKAFYDVNFGSNPVKLADLWSKQVGQVTAVSQLSESLASETADTVPPSVPTGLNVTSALRESEDGTSRPYAVAAWDANSETDMEAYEVQMDRAISGDTDFSLSASGTGGSLTAGTYVVKVTGVGAEGGETLQLGSVDQVVAAGEHLYVNITDRGPGIASYNIYVSIQAGDTDPLSNSQNTTTTGSDVEITTVGSGSVSPAYSTAVSFINPTSFRVGHPTVKLEVEDVEGGRYYAFRVNAVDDSLNKSDYCTPYGHKVIGDTDAPEIPTGVSLNSGYRVAGASWAPNSEPDLAYYEVRWAPESGSAPDTDQWTVVRAYTTGVVASGLDLDTTYYFQVRAVDRSGNVRTSATVSTAVQADAYPDAGWSNDGTDEEYITVIPSAVPSADMAFTSVITATLSATSQIDAASIVAGVLKVGGAVNAAEYVVVYNSSGDEIGRWDENGLLIKDPNNTDLQMFFVDGVLKFSQDGGTSWGTAIDANGIHADAITLGTAPGGHNAIPNSSFELSAFATLFSVLWTDATDWGGYISTPVYANTGTTSLQMTSASY